MGCGSPIGLHPCERAGTACVSPCPAPGARAESSAGQIRVLLAGWYYSRARASSKRAIALDRGCQSVPALPLLPHRCWRCRSLSIFAQGPAAAAHRAPFESSRFLLLCPRHKVTLHNLLDDLAAGKIERRDPVAAQRHAFRNSGGRTKRPQAAQRGPAPRRQQAASRQQAGSKQAASSLRLALACAGSRPSVRRAGLEASMPMKIKVGSPWICGSRRSRAVAARWARLQ